MMRAIISIHARKSVENVSAKALILLCQDRSRECWVIAGQKGDLQELLVWGARNWFILPPGDEYFRAVEEVLEPLVGKDGNDRIVLVSDGFRPSPGPRDSSMDFEIRLPPVTIALNDMTDALFFAIDEHGVKIRAAGGSGLQKQHLLMLGIEALFGTAAAEEFDRVLHANTPEGVRALIDDMRTRMRNAPDGPPTASPGTADAVPKKGWKN